MEAIDVAFADLEELERADSLSPLSVRVDSLDTHALSPSMRSLSRGYRTPSRSWSRVLSSQSSDAMATVASMYTNEAFELDLDDLKAEEQQPPTHF